MKALSLWEPWASLIALGPKKIEIRNWNTGYRGDLLICAAKVGMGKGAKDKEVHDAISTYQSADDCEEYLGLKRALLPADFVPQYGKAVAVVELYNSRSLTVADGLAACMQDPTGKIGFFLRKIRPFRKPFDVTGKQGLFDVAYEPDEEDFMPLGEKIPAVKPPDTVLVRPRLSPKNEVSAEHCKVCYFNRPSLDERFPVCKRDMAPSHQSKVRCCYHERNHS